MVLVSSEAIAEIAYDATARTLRIRFIDGDWYRYFDVPPAAHRALLAADSHGRHFHDHVRGSYACRRG